MSFLSSIKQLLNEYRLHISYIVPSDKEPVGLEGITRAMVDLRAWYRWQTGGRTFKLETPAVRVYRSSHPSDWFATNDPSPDPNHPIAQSAWFRQNSINDNKILVDAPIFTQYDAWGIYVDAVPALHQIAGGALRCFVEHHKPIMALMGQDPDWTLKRGIGGSGHEMGHGFGIHHPPPPPNPDWTRSIMGTGYTIYPNCIVDQPNLDILAASPWFYPTGPLPPYGTRPRPRPKPRPRILR